MIADLEDSGKSAGHFVLPGFHWYCKGCINAGYISDDQYKFTHYKSCLTMNHNVNIMQVLNSLCLFTILITQINKYKTYS